MNRQAVSRIDCRLPFWFDLETLEPCSQKTCALRAFHEEKQNQAGTGTSKRSVQALLFFYSAYRVQQPGRQGRSPERHLTRPAPAQMGWLENKAQGLLTGLLCSPRTAARKPGPKPRTAPDKACTSADGHKSSTEMAQAAATPAQRVEQRYIILDLPHNVICSVAQFRIHAHTPSHYGTAPRSLRSSPTCD